MEGTIFNIQRFSLHDGPGIRTTVFLSGCNLRCGFCHNPETLYKKGNEITPEALLERILRYKSYIKKGGVTLSGGEPFLQKEFVIAVCELLRREGINVCIETNGHIADAKIIAAADSFIVDVKNQESFDAGVYEKFISVTVSLDKPVKLTNVIVPDINDSSESLAKVSELSKMIPPELFGGVRFLPFRKLCKNKYERLGIEFPYAKYREGEKKDVDRVTEIYKSL